MKKCSLMRMYNFGFFAWLIWLVHILDYITDVRFYFTTNSPIIYHPFLLLFFFYPMVAIAILIWVDPAFKD